LEGILMYNTDVMNFVVGAKSFVIDNIVPELAEG